MESDVMQTVLLDTDVAIDYLRGMPYTKILILPLWERRIAYMSILSVYELYAGMRENEQDVTENLVMACKIEPVSMEIARKAGELYRKYRTQGITLTSLDCLVNATAIINKHKIATRNKEHYPNKDILKPIE